MWVSSVWSQGQKFMSQTRGNITLRTEFNCMLKIIGDVASPLLEPHLLQNGRPGPYHGPAQNSTYASVYPVANM